MNCSLHPWDFPGKSTGVRCHCQNAKVGSQETRGVTGKFGLGVQNEAGQRLLIEFCQENTLVIASTLFQQHKRRLYTWTSPDGQHRNQIDSILCNSAFKWEYLSFSPLLFASRLFTAICKATPDSHFAFLHFFFLGDGLDHCLLYNFMNLHPQLFSCHS